nr:conjugative transfer signal peptidase TraF [Moritella viscosa]
MLGWMMIALFSLSFTVYINGYRLNTSTSFPPGIYVIDAVKDVYQTQDLILFCPPNNNSVKTALARGYISQGRCKSQTTPMIKRVAAIYGDKVTLSDTISINNHELTNTTIKYQDSLKRSLIPFSLNGKSQFTVPYQQVFVYSDHAPSNSFDSRYFGPVPTNNIHGTVKSVLLIADVQAFIEELPYSAHLMFTQQK